MTKAQVCAQIDETAIIPAIRAGTADEAIFAAETVARGGIPIVELTMTVPGAPDVIARLRRDHPGMVVGAGTVLDLHAAKRCLDAGAMFLTSPGLVPEVMEFAAAGNIVRCRERSRRPKCCGRCGPARTISRFFPVPRSAAPAISAR